MTKKRLKDIATEYLSRGRERLRRSSIPLSEACDEVVSASGYFQAFIDFENQKVLELNEIEEIGELEDEH